MNHGSTLHANANASDFISELALRYLDAAYNLSRWLLGNQHDASDAVHDAYLRAQRSAHTYAGGNARAWWLAIVRNCCLARLAARGKEATHLALDDDSRALADWPPRSEASAVEDDLDQDRRQGQVRRALGELPEEFREVLILRELEELSYREIADVLQLPIGTVMSRLSRGRERLQKLLETVEYPHGL